MDRHTLELLEFPKICQLVAARAGSSFGKERAAALEPRSDQAWIQDQQAIVAEMVDALGARLEPPLGGLRDVRSWVKRSGIGVLLEIEQVLEVRDVLDLSGRMYDYWLRLGADYPHLEKLLSKLTDFRHLCRTIDAAIDERGRVRDNATPELGQIRAELAAHEERIQVELRRLLRSPEVRRALRYPQATVSGDHHVLPVAVNYRHTVAGVVHRTSSTGETIYIEPAKVAEISAEVAIIKNAELREIRKVLRRLTAVLGAEAEQILATIEVMGEIDFLRAKAVFSRDFDMNPAEISSDGRLSLDTARHPLLLELKRNRVKKPTPSPSEKGDVRIGDRQDEETSDEVVPISIRLGDDFDLLVITGPNTGGKTVTLKTVGLLSAMALAGLHIPARAGSRIPVFRDILADIGDEQSIQQSLSTFSSHISRIAGILKQGDRDTLVLLDELGAGTDPTEGAALGQAILDELVRLGCRGMVTTHLGDLKKYAFSAARVENGAVEFDDQSLRPTYRLLVGQFGQSCALKIARRLQLPRDVVHRAHQYVRRRGRRDPEMRRLADLRRQAQEAKDQAEMAKANADTAETEFRRKAELLQQEANISAEVDKFRASLKAGDIVRVARFDKQGTIRRVDPRKRVATVIVGAVEWQLPLNEILPLPQNLNS